MCKFTLLSSINTYPLARGICSNAGVYSSIIMRRLKYSYQYVISYLSSLIYQISHLLSLISHLHEISHLLSLISHLYLHHHETLEIEILILKCL